LKTKTIYAVATKPNTAFLPEKEEANKKPLKGRFLSFVDAVIRRFYQNRSILCYY
jgi:hypothetical protein